MAQFINLFRFGGALRSSMVFVAQMGIAILTAVLLAADAQASGQLVSVRGDWNLPAGSIVVSHRERSLYLMLDSRRALRYRVAVPKSGKEWSGTTAIQRKVRYPDWIAPEAVVRDHPEFRGVVIPGGDPRNPMGTRAIVLQDNQYVSQVAIHGTSRKMRSSIGTAASYGCIRMLNEDVEELFDRVSEGALVVMIR